MKIENFNQKFKSNLEDNNLTNHLGTILRAQMIEKLIKRSKTEIKNINNFSKILNNLILEYLISQDYKFTQSIFTKEIKCFQKVENDKNLNKDTLNLLLTFFKKEKSFLKEIESESVLELLIKNLFKEKFFDNKGIQTKLENQDFNEILTIEEKFAVVDEKFEFETRKNDPFIYMEGKMNEIKKKLENEFKERVLRFRNNEKFVIYKEIRDELKEEYEKKKNILEKNFNQKYSLLIEKEKSLSNNLKNSIKEIKKNYEKKNEEFLNKKNLETKKLEILKLNLEDKKINLKEKTIYLNYLSETIEKRKNEVDKKEKNMDMEIYNEIKNAKFSTLKEIEDKKNLFDMKIKLVDDEYENIRDIRNDLKKLDEEKKNLELENCNLKKKINSEKFWKQDSEKKMKYLNIKINENENIMKEMISLSDNLKLKNNNLKIEKKNLEKMFLEYKNLFTSKNIENEKLVKDHNIKIEEYKFLLNDMKIKFLENELLNNQINQEKNKDPLEDFHRLIKKNDLNKKKYLTNLNKMKNNTLKKEIKNESFQKIKKKTKNLDLFKNSLQMEKNNLNDVGKKKDGKFSSLVSSYFEEQKESEKKLSPKINSDSLLDEF